MGAEAQRVEAAVEAALEGEDLPPAWVDVTIAVRFLVDNGALQLHKVSSVDSDETHVVT